MARFSYHPERCVRCHACEVACAMLHDKGVQEGFRRIEEREVGTFPHVTRTFTTRVLPGCDLCAPDGSGPRCAKTCPTKELVLID